MIKKALRYATWVGGNCRVLLQYGNVSATAVFLFRCVIRSKQPVAVNIGGRQIFVRPGTPDLDVAVSCFSGEFSEAIRAATPLRHSFIIDGGGYIGTAAIAFAEAFPSAWVVTIEPSDVNFTILEKNVTPYRNITPVKEALGPTIGSIPLQNLSSREWGFSTVTELNSGVKASFLHVTKVTTIDSLMAEHNAKGIDLLKLDIEGAELDLLKDCPAWVHLTRVIIAELHDRVIAGCSEALTRATAGRPHATSGEKVLVTLPEQ